MRFDVAIVGLGALGSAAAYQLARRGKRVIGFEQFDLGHSRGASHDTSRIIRRTLRSPQYVGLADAAYRDWRDLETRAGEKLVTRTGGVILVDESAPVTAESFAQSLDAHEVRYELWDHRELRARYPQFRVPEAVEAVYQEDTGIVPAARTTTLLQVLAREMGAVLRARTEVVSLESAEDGVVVVAGADRIHAESVVLCADAWSNRLLRGLGIELPLRHTLEQVSYFQPEQPDRYDSDAFPVWVWEGEHCYYGFPTYGESTVKSARDISDIPLDPWNRSFEPVPEREEELVEFMDGLLPGSGRVIRTLTCQYSLTPDRHFVLDTLPGNPRISMALGAGHAFKFVPTIGRILADLATGQDVSEDISLFSVERAALTAPSGGAEV